MKSILFLFLIFYSTTVFSQIKTKIINYDEIRNSNTCLGVNHINHNYYIEPSFELPEKLPEGRYLVYETDYKKRKHLKLMCSYSKDSLKNGTFVYYELFETNGKSENLVRLIYNFRNGELDGIFAAFAGNNIYSSGDYNRGKKQGIFKNYSFNEPHYLENEESYLNDTFIKIIKYVPETRLISEIFEQFDSTSKYTRTYYNTNGLLKVSYVSKGKDQFIKTTYNENGFIESIEEVDRIIEIPLGQH